MVNFLKAPTLIFYFIAICLVTQLTTVSLDHPNY